MIEDTNLYFVKDHDENTVTIRQSIYRFITVTIERSHIVAVKRAGGLIIVETTGGARYRIASGARRKQLRLTEEAFA